MTTLTTEPVFRTRRLTRVMGCDASVTVTGAADSLLDLAERRLRDLERRWSRFLPDSEVTRLALHAGEPVRVSAETRTLVRALVAASVATDGAFDPTLLPDLVRNGYRASVHDQRLSTRVAPGSATFDVADISVDDDAGTVRLPRSGTLDPGGLGKGLAADIVVAELLAAGASGALVEIGGDLQAEGDAPQASGWTVDVEDPRDGAGTTTPPLAVLHLARGGVATSSRAHRRWTTNGTEHHHLLDPATGCATATDVLAATVLAATGAWAEAWSTVAFVHGSRDGLELLEAAGAAALVVRTDRSIEHTSAWTEFAA